MRGLQRQRECPGAGASANQDEVRGFDFELSEQQVDAYDVGARKDPRELASPPAIRFLEYETKTEGYWTADNLCERVADITGC